LPERFKHHLKMPLQLGWAEVAIRLLCAIAAGLVIGFDRGEHDRVAGLRT
jgi:uncharacterized membrane protein YhiD involved in acid resistance